MPDKPVLLIFYALPNGNTIEQTIGKVLKPDNDWHFDIQHIGAQMRWLRTELTNRTLVVAYLEAATKSWPTWRKAHDAAAREMERSIAARPLSELTEFSTGSAAIWV